MRRSEWAKNKADAEEARRQLDETMAREWWISGNCRVTVTEECHFFVGDRSHKVSDASKFTPAEFRALAERRETFDAWMRGDLDDLPPSEGPP